MNEGQVFYFHDAKYPLFLLSRRNFLEISVENLNITQHYIFGVLVFLLFGRCIYVLVAYHHKSYNGYYFKQQKNWVHSAKVEEVEIVMSLLNTPLGSRM